MSTREAWSRLSAAKLWLTAPTAGDAPYLSAALYAVPVVLTDRVGSLAADDRWRVYANPAWVLAADVPQVGVHLEHLVWHLLREHAERARSMGVGARESQAWTRAADLTVAQTLTASGHHSAGLPLPAELHVPADLAVEQYYALLGRLTVEPDDGGAVHRGRCGSAADGLPRDYDVPGDVEMTVDQALARHLREQVVIAFDGYMQQRGTVPGEWARWVEQVLEPKVPWQQVLSSSVRRAVAWSHGHADSTYRRMSRRQAASPRAILPGTRRPVPGVAIVVDTSASMDDGLLAQALGEVDGVLRALGTAVGGVDVLTCDADVHAVTKVTSARRLDMVGGGGTDLRIGMAAAFQLRPRPEVLIVLTDGFTPWPETAPPGCAVVAVLITRDGSSDAPDWASVVHLDLSNR